MLKMISRTNLVENNTEKKENDVEDFVDNNLESST